MPGCDEGKEGSPGPSDGWGVKSAAYGGNQHQISFGKPCTSAPLQAFDDMCFAKDCEFVPFLSSLWHFGQATAVELVVLTAVHESAVVTPVWWVGGTGGAGNGIYG
jgi:hypothetical protein